MFPDPIIPEPKDPERPIEPEPEVHPGQIAPIIHVTDDISDRLTALNILMGEEYAN